MTDSIADLLVETDAPEADRVRLLKWTFLSLVALSLTLTGLAFGTAAFVLSLVSSASTLLAMMCFEIQSEPISGDA